MIHDQEGNDLKCCIYYHFPFSYKTDVNFMMNRVGLILKHSNII